MSQQLTTVDLTLFQTLCFLYTWQSSEKVKVAQLCPTLCDPMDYTVDGILQARILEWVAYPFSRGSSWPRNRTGVNCIAGRFFTSWTIGKPYWKFSLTLWLKPLLLATVPLVSLLILNFLQAQLYTSSCLCFPYSFYVFGKIFMYQWHLNLILNLNFSSDL